MIRERTGDLIMEAGDFEVIVHGTNCFCEMKSGIAKQIIAKFPEAQRIDADTAKGDRKKLGTISFTKNTSPVVVNAYTQFEFGTDKMNCDYDALTKCMKAIKKNFRDMKIGLPQIGAGLAGGDWGIIKQIIYDELADEDVTIVYWKNEN